MLSERREQIFLRAEFIEMMELWDLATIPQWRLPATIVHDRMLQYFAYQLRQALKEDNSQVLGEVLIELYLVASGEDPVEGWEPPVPCQGAELRLPLS
jgi:hypothetical protein